MSKLDNSTTISFRQFDRLDGNTYVAYEFAWPVEVIECYANKVAEGTLDALSETVLELLTVPEMSTKKIAVYLMISEEIVNSILKFLIKHKYYSHEDNEVTHIGKKYIDDKETGSFQEEKVFGNMFISKIDREVFPYFYEGQLPWAQYEKDIQYLSLDVDKADVDDKNLLDKVNRAYHKYGRIYKASKEFSENGFNKFGPDFFVEGELKERSFDSDCKTLEELEEKKKLTNGRIKVLKTPHREIYIKARVCVSKAAPDKFLIDSPFKLNQTQWYTDCFARMRDDNQLIYVTDRNEIGLDFYCDDITTQFFVEYPEMQGSNFEQYIKINFNKMLSFSISKECMEKYHEIFNLNLLCNDKNVIKKHVVITESAKAIEMILNNFVFRIKKNDITRKFMQIIKTQEELRELFMNFGINKCAGLSKEISYMDKVGTVSIMKSFQNSRNGQSILEKYFFLTIEAYFNEESHFRKLLNAEGEQFIKAVDYINTKRNKYGAHNDGVKPEQIPMEDFVEFQRLFKYITKVLIEYLD